MTRAAPWSRTKADARVFSPNEEWANRVDGLMLNSLHPFQRAAAADPSRRISYLTGRGGGKTTTKMVRAGRKLAKIYKAKLVYIAVTRPHAEELMWLPLKDLNERAGLELDFAESKMRATCRRTGATFRCVGADDKREIEKLRGQPFDEVQIDEGASHSPTLLEHLIIRVVGPRLGDRKGCLVLGGTPGHILNGLFYDATRPGSPLHRRWSDKDLPEFANWTAWSSHHWNLSMVVGLPDARKKYPALVSLWEEALIEKATNGWSDDHPVWKREYLGEWAADDTDTVFRYRPSVNQWDPPRTEAKGGVPSFAVLPDLSDEIQNWQPDWEYVIAMDQGHADPFACDVFALSPTDPKRRIWHVYGYSRTKFYSQLVAKLLLGEDLDHRKPAGIFAHTGWPAAHVWDADLAQIDELAQVYGVKVTKAERKADYKFGAIELVNGDLVDGRIFVIKGSELEKQLLNLQWKVNDLGQLKEDPAQANHNTDDLIYARLEIANLFKTGRIPDPGSAPPSGYRDPMGLDGPDEERDNPWGDGNEEDNPWSG